MNPVDIVVAALRDAEEPQTVGQVASVTGLDNKDVDRVVWSDPARFAWQPGHRWTLCGAKARPRGHYSDDVQEARSGGLSSNAPSELRAITLASGLTIRISRRPLDSDAFVTVRSAGNVLELVLNSTHELFGELPMPFRDDAGDSGYQRLVEVLLEAWALYEDSVPGGPARRATEDARLLWGRRVLEILRDSD